MLAVVPNSAGSVDMSKNTAPCPPYTNKKENQIFLIYKEIQSGAVAQSYIRKGFLIYEETRKYFPIYEQFKYKYTEW